MTEWISWNGGECPIPGAKVGEYEVEFEDGAMRGNHQENFHGTGR